ncbi:hypothetical protein TU65_23870 [Bacillus wiedmannii]|uniref:hypothetical protein n=2 Tax=Bacillus wiedmannii TaxID=1890302 RepID=UPI00065BA0BC|nr:hypothetical protein [Bacillus wiedmannii]KMP91522.1 hypothetical protein TU65_23870 [Bacillus wiedmannii]PEJ69166.1 hypothetical protein CN888_25680 [Bacillus wiedmannii]PEL19492.1 hypothetical protein CN599_08465 [Bacillus wiedmannii]PHG49188.1 hypothetical protein COI54_10840 [Bacillus wiedmannii]
MIEFHLNVYYNIIIKIECSEFMNFEWISIDTNWLGFWGGVLGGFISGGLTYLGVRKTIKNERKSFFTNRIWEEKKDVLKKLMEHWIWLVTGDKTGENYLEFMKALNSVLIVFSDSPGVLVKLVVFHDYVNVKCNGNANELLIELFKAMYEDLDLEFDEKLKDVLLITFK